MTREKFCSICKIPFEGNHCSCCGQTFSGKPTSTISLLIDFLSNFFSVEKSGFATIFKVLKSPKPIVENYYSGYKNYYASPGKIILYGIAVVALHINFVDNKVMGLSLNAENLNTQYLFWLYLFPVLLFSSYMAFILVERHLSKHLISLAYVATSLFIALTLLNDLFILTVGDKFGIWTFIVFVSLVFFWNSRVLTTSKKYMYILLNTVIQAAIFAGIVGILIWITKQ